MCDCDQALEWISAALDGALTPEEQRGLDGHLAACAECRALAAEFDAVCEMSMGLPHVWKGALPHA